MLLAELDRQRLLRADVLRAFSCTTFYSLLLLSPELPTPSRTLTMDLGHLRRPDLAGEGQHIMGLIHHSLVRKGMKKVRTLSQGTLSGELYMFVLENTVHQLFVDYFL